MILIILFVCLESYFYAKTYTFFKNNMGGLIVKYTLKKDSFEHKFDNEITEVMRKPVGLNYKKKPILFLGCSYVFGVLLDEENTISSQISKKTKRPVYNWGYPAWGIQHAYYMIDKMPKIEPDPEYIFYIHIKDHMRRMYENLKFDDDAEYLQYKIKNGKLERIDNRYNLFDNSHFLSMLKRNFFDYYATSKKSLKYFLSYACCLQNEIREKYPNSKFVIIIYDCMSEEFIKELKKNNINVFYLKDIKDFNYDDEKYKLSKEVDYFRHPNEKAWDVVSDAIIKEYHL